MLRRARRADRIDEQGIRPSTFLDGSMVAHAMFGEPFDKELSSFIVPHIEQAIKSFDGHIDPKDPARLHTDKTVVVMEGPQFSTRAESNMYRQWGGDIINMSTIPEAKLAREAELRWVSDSLLSLSYADCPLPATRSFAQGQFRVLARGYDRS